LCGDAGDSAWLGEAGAQSVVGAGHELRRHALDPLLASLALFDSAEDLEARVHTLFNVRGGGRGQAGRDRRDLKGVKQRG
jgi:hypothetical protein